MAKRLLPPGRRTPDPGPSIWQYAPLLPVRAAEYCPSLGEGGTLLVELPRLVVEESKGPAFPVDDSSMLEAQQIPSAEGLFGEPSSAAALAALVVACRNSRLEIGSEVVPVATSSGLKDMEGASRWHGPVPAIEPTREALEKVLDSA
ncbi:MAG: hypothetical protein ACHQ7N_20560 [Candidatus Methylomirabilales bacterium]